MRRAGYGLVAVCALMGLQDGARAEDFNGKTAAYIDWAVKNCECTSTDQEHKLVENANATGPAHEAFQKSYLVQFQSKELTDALSAEKPRLDKCEVLKGWFGPAGSRIAGLLTWAKAPASSSSGTTLAPATSGAKRGRRHGQ